VCVEMAVSWCSRYGRVNYPACTRGFLGRSIRPEVNETAPEVLSPGAAAGNCLLALTRQPLRRPGQPKAAAPDSCIRAASAPGERSCLHGKPMADTGQLYFPGYSAMRCRGPGDGARIPAGAGLSVRRGSRCGRAGDWPGPGPDGQGRVVDGLAWSAVRMERGMAGRGRGARGARAGWMGTVGDGNSGLTEGRREKTE
jgi:hypothetical protein